MSLRVYDVAGRLVRTLLDRAQPAGPGSVIWDGTDDRGVRLGSGVFFARMQAEGWRSDRKLVVVGP